MPTHAYMVASRTPIVTSNGPAEPGALLENFDPDADSRHIESGAVVEVEVDPALTSDDPADPPADPATDQDGDGEPAAPKPSRRRRSTTTEEHNDAV